MANDTKKAAVKGIIFDLDGVLVDTDICHYLSWKNIADSLGIPFDEDINHLIRGVSRRESLMIINNGRLKFSEDEIEKIMEDKNSVYIEMIKRRGKSLLIPGALEFVTKLKNMSYKLAVSSCSRNVNTILEVSGLGQKWFDAVVDGNMIAKSKPDPEIFLMAAEQMGVVPASCVVFEDAPAGIEAAMKAGMVAFGVGPATLKHCHLKKDSIAEFTVEDIKSV